MTEVKPEEKSDDSADTDDEQKTEESEPEEESVEDNKTPVIKTTEKSDHDITSVEEETSEEEKSDTEAMTGELNAAEATEVNVDVKTRKDVEVEEDGKKKIVEEDADASDAEVTFTGGCVNDGKLVDGKDLTFKVEPGAGRVLVSIGYKLSDAKEDAKPTDLGAATPGLEKKIESSKLITKAGAKSVTIYVKTKAATYDVSFTGSDVFEIISEGDDEGKLAKAEVSAAIEIPHGESKEFAVVVADTKILDEDGIKLNGIAVPHDNVEEFDQVDNAAKVEAFRFEVDPSAYGLNSNAVNTAAAVAITVRDAYALTVTDVTTPANAALKEYSGTGENLVKMGTDGAFATKPKMTEDNEDYADLTLAFAVKPDTNYKIASVTAEVTDSKGKAEVTVSEGEEITEEGPNKGNIEYTIDLDQDALELTDNKTVTITIETALDDSDENENIHRISFAAEDGSDLRNVTVMGTPKGGEEEPLTDLTKTVNTLADDYTIKVAPENGYALTVGDKSEGGNLDAEDEEEAALDGKAFVTIEETRKYGTGEDAITPDPIVYKAEVAAEGIKIDLKGSDTKYEEDAETAKAYVVLSATVTIGVSEKKNDDEKIIAFADELGTEDKDSYAITNTAGVVKDEYVPTVYESFEDSTYAIAKSVDLLTFSVTSAITPKVMLSIDDTESELEALTSEGGVYTYSVPTKLLDADTAKVNKIVIDKKFGDPKAVKVTIDKVANLDATTYIIEGEKQTPSLSNGVYTLDTQVGQEVELVFTAAKNVTFGEIVAKMGEEDLQVTSGTAGGLNTATIKTVVTDAITVDVKTVAPYYVELSTAADSSLKQEEDGSYTVDYTETNIVVDLKAADTGVIEDFYDIAVKDGSSTAVTKAEINKTNHNALIAKIDPKEWGKTLTIEVQRTKDKAEKYTATLKVSAASDQVTVTNMETGEVVKKDAAVNMRRDSQISFRIDPKSGANRKDLKLEIRAAKDNATATENKNAQALFENGNDVAFDGDGVVTLKALPGAAAAADAVKLCVLNSKKGADDKKNENPLEGGEVTINITDPVVKSTDIAGITATEASSSNRKVKLNLNVNLANKKALINTPIEGELYYRVELKDVKADMKEGTLEVIKGDDLVKFYKIAKSGSTYSAADFAKYAEFDLAVKYTDKDKKVVDLEDPTVDLPGTISATAEVTLVQDFDGEGLTAKSAADKNYAAGATASAALSTRRPVYETKLTVKKVNNATVYTGQTAVIATPTFSKDTSYNDAYAVFVNTKTGKLLNSSWNNFSTYVSGGSVYVSVNKSVKVANLKSNDDFKNLGVKIIAPAPEQGYEATAIVKLSVKQGIYNIDANRSKAALTEELYQDAKGNVKSVKITPQYNDGNSNYKPAKAAVTWEITDSTGNGTDGLDANIKAAITGKKPLIKVKSGTVSVDKKYVRKATSTNTDADTFYVTAKANDFAGNTAKKVFAFTITGQNQTIGKLVVVDSGNYPLPAASLKAEDFKKSLYVAAVKPGVDDSAKNFAYTPSTDFVPVTFKASGKLVTVGVTDPFTNKAPLTFYKKGKVKITATTVDGGKGAGTKDTITLEVANYEQLGLRLKSSSGITTEPDSTTVKYFGGSNERYELSLMYYDSAAKEWKNDSSYKNVKIKVDGGKFVSDPDWKKSGSLMGWAVVVNKASGAASITLTDTVSKKSTKYTITNGSNATVKAPSVKLVEPKKLTISDYTDLKFQVKASDKKVENYAGKYVKLTPDFTLLSTKNPGAWYILGQSGVIEKLDENGQFTLKNKYLNDAGTYKLVATVGDLSDGEFKALAKDAKVSLKVANRKYDDKLKVTANYALNEKGAAVAQIQVKTDSTYYVGDAKNITKQAKEIGDAHANNFTKYFEVRNNKDEYDDYTSLWNKTANDEGNYAYIAMKSDLSAADIAYITGQNPETAKQAKEDCEGYITVWNGTYQTDVKIKISFSKKVTYSAAAPTAYASAKAIKLPVEIYNGKTLVPIADAVLDGANGFTSKKPEVKDGQITLESVANLAASDKPYEVKMMVLPIDAAYNADTKDTNEKGGVKLKDLAATYGVPVTLKVTVKDLSAAKMINANVKVSLSSAAYTEKNGNGYEQAKTTGKGNYVVDIPYTIAAYNGALASKNPVAAQFEGNEIVNGKDKMTLVTASAEVVDKYEGNTVVGTQNVIRLTVSKQAIEYYSSMDKKAKPITGWGKKLKAPVTVQLANGNKENAALETLNFEITLPKEPKSFKDVQDIVKNAGIEKYQTAKAEKASVILNSLMNKINAKLESIIPADSDVKIESLAVTGVKPEKGSAATDPEVIVEAGTAVVTLKLKDVANKDAELAEQTWTYTNLGVKATKPEVSGSETAAKVKAAINTFLSGYTATNETTADSLDADIRAAEADDIKNNIGERRGNVSIKILKFVKLNATTKDAGWINVTIRVKDLLHGTTETITDRTLPIAKLTNIVDAYTAVKTAVTGANLTTIIQNCGGNEELIRAEILSEAVKAAKNPAITIEYKADSFAYKKVIAENGEDENGETIAEGRKGTLAFTLLITENGRVKELDGRAEIAITEAEKYVDIDTASEKVSAKVAADNDGTTVILSSLVTALKSAIASAGEDDDINDVIKTTVKEAADEAVDGTTAGSVYGYEVDVTDIEYIPSTATKKGTVSFKVLVKSKKGEISDTIEVEATEVMDLDKTNMTKDEFKEAWAGMTTAITGGLPADKAAALTLIASKAEALVEGVQAGELEGATTFEAASDATAEVDADNDNKVTALTGVTVTIKDKDGNVIYTTDEAKDFTFAS